MFTCDTIKCAHYVNDVNYCGLIMVMFPLGSMGERLPHVRMRV